MKDKTLRALLLSPTATVDENLNCRTSTWTFPQADENDIDIRFTYRVADGLIVYLMKRIIKLENRVTELEANKKTE